MSSMTHCTSHAMAHWKVPLFGQFSSVEITASSASTTDLFNRCSLSVPVFKCALLHFPLIGRLLLLLTKHCCCASSDRGFKHSSNSSCPYPGTP